MVDGTCTNVNITWPFPEVNVDIKCRKKILLLQNLLKKSISVGHILRFDLVFEVLVAWNSITWSFSVMCVVVEAHGLCANATLEAHCLSYNFYHYFLHFGTPCSKHLYKMNHFLNFFDKFFLWMKLSIKSQYKCCAGIKQDLSPKNIWHLVWSNSCTF